MKRTTIFLDESVERDLQLMAKRRGVPKAELVRQALKRFLDSEGTQGRLPSFVGIGRSGRSDIAERHEEILAEEWGRGHPLDDAGSSDGQRNVTTEAAGKSGAGRSSHEKKAS